MGVGHYLWPLNFILMFSFLILNNNSPSLDLLSLLSEVSRLSFDSVFILWTKFLIPSISNLSEEEPEHLLSIINHMAAMIDLETSSPYSYLGLTPLALSLVGSFYHEISETYEIYPSGAFLSHFISNGDPISSIVLLESLTSSDSPAVEQLCLLSLAYKQANQPALVTAINSRLARDLCQGDIEGSHLKGFSFEVVSKSEAAHAEYTKALKQFTSTTNFSNFPTHYLPYKLITEHWADTAAQLSRWDLLTSLDSSYFVSGNDLPIQANLATGTWNSAKLNSGEVFSKLSILGPLYKVYSSLQQHFDVQSTVSVTKKQSLQEEKVLDDMAIENSTILDKIIAADTVYASFSNVLPIRSFFKIITNSTISNDANVSFTTFKKNQ
ncbi:hypothetical protein GEMRC1_001713 [Eukaryota sp. GEM-RC1]